MTHAWRSCTHTHMYPAYSSQLSCLSATNLTSIFWRVWLNLSTNPLAWNCHDTCYQHACMLGFYRICLHKFTEIVATDEDVAMSLCTRSERADQINTNIMLWWHNWHRMELWSCLANLPASSLTHITCLNLIWGSELHGLLMNRQVVTIYYSVSITNQYSTTCQKFN